MPEGSGLRGRGTCLRCAFLALVLLASGTSRAAPDGDASALVEMHLRGRQESLDRQQSSSHELGRQHAWMAYRLSQKRKRGFFSRSDRRPEQAGAAAMALLVLARTLDEGAKIGTERAQVEQERGRLAAARSSADRAVRDEGPPPLVWPSKGPVISGPGLRTDPVTKVVLRDPGVQILGRVDAQVAAPLEGAIAAVETLPGGGHAVVVAHASGWVAVLSGLRLVQVRMGEVVQAGQAVGRVGRTLDGAPVLRFSLWHHGNAVDPRPPRALR